MSVTVKAAIPDMEAWALMCYGCDIEEFKESVLNSVTYEVTGGYMVAMSLMSDAQHLMEIRHHEDARQTLNRAKWVISQCASGKMVFKQPR